MRCSCCGATYRCIDCCTVTSGSTTADTTQQAAPKQAATHQAMPPQAAPRQIHHNRQSKNSLTNFQIVLTSPVLYIELKKISTFKTVAEPPHFGGFGRFFLLSVPAPFLCWRLRPRGLQLGGGSNLKKGCTGTGTYYAKNIATQFYVITDIS